MGLEIIILSEIRQSQILYDINITKDSTSEFIDKTGSLTDIESQLMATKGERLGGRGGIKWKYGINRYILPYIKQINSKDLLYSTGKYIQYLAINSN